MAEFTPEQRRALSLCYQLLLSVPFPEEKQQADRPDRETPAVSAGVSTLITDMRQQDDYEQ